MALSDKLKDYYAIGSLVLGLAIGIGSYCYSNDNDFRIKPIGHSKNYIAQNNSFNHAKRIAFSAGLGVLATSLLLLPLGGTFRKKDEIDRRDC